MHDLEMSIRRALKPFEGCPLTLETRTQIKATLRTCIEKAIRDDIALGTTKLQDARFYLIENDDKTLSVTLFTGKKVTQKELEAKAREQSDLHLTQRDSTR